jgi:hypothetical protein
MIKKKDELCILHKIDLIRIPYTEKNIRMYICHQLLSKGYKCPNSIEDFINDNTFNKRVLDSCSAFDKHIRVVKKHLKVLNFSLVSEHKVDGLFEIRCNVCRVTMWRSYSGIRSSARIKNKNYCRNCPIIDLTEKFKPMIEKYGFEFISIETNGSTVINMQCWYCNFESRKSTSIIREYTNSNGITSLIPGCKCWCTTPIMRRIKDKDKILDLFNKSYKDKPLYDILLKELYNIYYTKVNTFADKQYSQDEYNILLKHVVSSIDKYKIQVVKQLDQLRIEYTDKLKNSLFYKNYQVNYESDIDLIREFNVFYDNMEPTLDKKVIQHLSTQWISSMNKYGVANLLHKLTKLNIEICEYIMTFI